MVDAYLIRSLKRVHDQAAETLESTESPSSKVIAGRFNEVLEEFREEYPDEGRLDDIDPVEGRTTSMTNHDSFDAAKEDLRRVKLQAEQMADALELDVGDFERVDGVNDIRPIEINLKAEATQNTEVTQKQEMDFSPLIDLADDAMLSDDDTDELKEMVRRFEDELEADETDESRLRSIVGSTKQIGAGVGTQVAARLTMAGLEAGYDLIP